MLFIETASNNFGKMSSVTTDENLENTCVVCFKNVEIFSIGECEHPVCYECSTRMRVLCRQTECPICRQDMPKVIFTKNIRPFREIRNGSYLSDRKFKIDFDNSKIRQAYDSLLSHVCPKCPEKIAFQNFLLLKEHMRRNHELFYCELCVDNLKILTCERRCYTRRELDQHRKYGDVDDKSHKGHPLCEFCDKRYMDKDELCRHLRRDHLFCHFCDADGYNQYYGTYDTLRDHFRSEHYLCEEGACYEEKFTAVFRTDIDLKAHRASVHGRSLGKAATKQARTLELAFRLAPRPGVDYQRRGGGLRGPRFVPLDDWSDEGAVGGSYEDSQNQNYFRNNGGSLSQLNTNCTDEFPSLGGGNMNAQPAYINKKTMSNLTIRAAVQGGRELAITDENFPALGPEATVSLRVNSMTSERPKSVGQMTKMQPTNFSIHVNHRPSRVTSAGGPTLPNNGRSKEDFPALSPKVTQPVKQLAMTQWSSARELEPKVSVIKSNKAVQPASPPKLRQNFSIENDNFPQLSSRFEAGCSVRPEPKSTTNSSSSYNQQESKSTKKATSLTVPVSDPWVPLVRDRSNGNISSDSEIGSRTGNKKKKKKSGGKNASDGGGGGSAVGSSSKSSQPGQRNNTLDTKKGLEGEAKKKKQKQDKLSKEELNNAENKKPDNSGTLERKRTELKIGLSTNRSADVNSEKDGNFNSSNENSSSSKGIYTPPGFIDLLRDKPPPGFETATITSTPVPATASTPAPPPGFSIKLNSVARSQTPANSNGLTFTNSSGQSYAITPGSNMTSTDHTYVPPPNFAPRNGELVESVMFALKDATKLEEFRNMSFRFRQNLLSAKDYYNHCQHAMGTDFVSIFPELIVLLPDIQKQQELWSVHQMSEPSINTSKYPKTSRLDVCPTCRQVVNSEDLSQHVSSHTLESQFPVLSNGFSNQSLTKK